MGRKTGIALLAATASLSFCLPPVVGQPSDQFYKGRTVTIIAGSAPGGGYDLYARLIARTIGKHISGKPTVIVTNMPGAASNVAAAHIANVAPRDGSVIGALYMGAIVEPLFGAQPRTTHDISKFNFIGNANKDTYICIARTDAPVKTFAELFEREVVFGGSWDGASTRDFPLALRNVLGAKLKVVTGYQGTRQINNAIDKGEVQGGCGQVWSSLSSTYPHWFESNFVRVLAQEDSVGHPDLNAKGVPLTFAFVKTPEQRAKLELLYSQTDFARPYVVAPGVPPDRVAVLRTAFAATMTDPELVAEAKRIKLDIAWTGGEELQPKLARIYAVPPEIVAGVRKAIAGSE